jgi:cell division protein FtsW
MNEIIDNKDTSVLLNWWLNIDKSLLISFFVLSFFGLVISFTIKPGSSLVDEVSIFNAFTIQSAYLVMGINIFILISFIDLKNLKKYAPLLYIVLFILLLATIIPSFGIEKKGSSRWLDFTFITLMPVELIKPIFCIILALTLENKIDKINSKKYFYSFILYILVALILIKQPDIGQLVIVSAIFISSFFLSGFSFPILIIIIFLGLISFIGIYFFNSNVEYRVNSFLSPEQYDISQATRSISAFIEGGFFGVGQGEGKLKNDLQESHTDYIFAVIAEEYGVIGCLIILFLFFYIAYRSFRRAYNEKDHFVQLCLFSLTVYLSLQTLVHAAVNLRLIPSTGMTLPFISYGGSSILGISFTLGLMLLLTKKSHN